MVRWFSQHLWANRQNKPTGSELASRKRWHRHGEGANKHEGREAWERMEVRQSTTPLTFIPHGMYNNRYT